MLVVLLMLLRVVRLRQRVELHQLVQVVVALLRRFLLLFLIKLLLIPLLVVLRFDRLLVLLLLLMIQLTQKQGLLQLLLQEHILQIRFRVGSLLLRLLSYKVSHVRR